MTHLHCASCGAGLIDGTCPAGHAPPPNNPVPPDALDQPAWAILLDLRARGYTGWTHAGTVDRATAISCFLLSGYVAVHVPTGATLTASYGRGRAGTAPRYTLTVPLPPAARQADRHGTTATRRYHHLRAWTDREAVQAAAVYLAKFLQRLAQ